ncbi:MAG: hypothetical protein ACRD0K_00855 [Egibacteraceae bacterium]
MRATSARWGLDRAEFVTTGLAAVVSSSLYVAYHAPYLARGVVGDCLGFSALLVPLVARRRRARHEALVCLAGIGLVHLLGWDWPPRYPSWLWWTVFGAGLISYLAARRATLEGVTRDAHKPDPGN